MRRGVSIVALLVAGLCVAAPASAHPRPPVPAPVVAPGCDPLGRGASACSPGRTTTSRRPARTATGRQLALTASITPRNASGVPIEPSDYNRSDGFSPGQAIVLKVPGLDTPAALARTGAVPVTDLARTYDRRAPIVVINARTGHRQLIWAELDSNATLRGHHRAPHPSGQELHARASATSWRCATSAAPTAQARGRAAPSSSTATA